MKQLEEKLNRTIVRYVLAITKIDKIINDEN